MNTTNSGATQPGVLLSSLLKNAVIDAKGKQLGKFADAVVHLRNNGYPLVTALVVRVGASTVFVPIADVVAIGNDRIELSTARLDVRPFERRAGEVLLKTDVLGHRLIDVDRATLVRAHDIHVTQTVEGWIVTGVNVHKRNWRSGPRHESQPARDWRSFEALIGHRPSFLVRSPFGQVRGLKAAQLADLIETASTPEQDELLAQVHRDPELEADVFEELDEDSQAHLLASRTVEEVAAVLARMRADDAADAISDLRQGRRQTVLALMPEPQHTRILTLLGYHQETAGGLMGVEFLAVAEHETVEHAISLLREARDRQPEALTTIYSVNSDGHLAGAISVVRALQTQQSQTLAQVAEANPVHAKPNDDIIDITTRMADFNLLTLPVVDDYGRILGVITVDDVLEAAMPEDWRRREPHAHGPATGAIEVSHPGGS